jgi:GTP-binding protein
MLVTELNIVFQAGKGGDGKVSFYKYRRGPDGGSGGRGGNIYISATSDIYALSNLRKLKKVKAQDGQDGMANNKFGKDALDLDIKLPIGTIITDVDTGETFEVNQMSTKLLICKGGMGGKGNWALRSSTNTTPQMAEKGISGQKRNLFINLKFIADFGFIGFPNVGKSSLLKELTRANPKIGNYYFTTIDPNLGELNGKIIADIPGLIEGASQGRGLGAKFLKHIEKVVLIFHCISCESENLLKDYKVIKKELKEFNPKLLEKPEVILLTKTDLKSKSAVNSYIKSLKSLNKKIIPVSIHDWESLKKIKTIISGN